MTIVDAGPLVALIDKGQTNTHEKCLAALRELNRDSFEVIPLN